MTTKGIYHTLVTQLDKLARHNRQGSFRTKDRYYEAVKRFCAYLAVHYHLQKLENISGKHLVSYVLYLQEQGKSASTIKTDLSAIRFFHDKMSHPRYALPGNEELGVALERRRFGQQDRTWTNPEFGKLIGRAMAEEREDYILALYLARYAGLRIHECFRMDTAAAECALRENALTVKGKGGKIRIVLIEDDRITMMLQRVLEKTERGHKLLVPDGVPTDRAINGMQQFILRHRDTICDPTAADRRISFHGLRHTYANTREEAAHWIALTLVSETSKAAPSLASELLLKDFLHRWLTTFKTYEVCSRTMELYYSCERLHIVPALGDIPVAAKDGTGGEADFCVRKTLSKCENPLRCLPKERELMDGVDFGGFAQTIEVKGAGTCIEPWSLLQVVPGGKIYIPMYAGEAGTDYYEPAAPFENVKDHYVVLDATGCNRYKVGYHAAAITGRLAYACKWNGRSCLLVRSFPNEPSGFYEEEPPLQPGVRGFSVHVYNDGGPDHGFAEIECSLPAVLGEYGRSSCMDTIATWIYVGKEENLKRIGKILLGCEVEFK